MKRKRGKLVEHEDGRQGFAYSGGPLHTGIEIFVSFREQNYKLLEYLTLVTNLNCCPNVVPEIILQQNDPKIKKPYNIILLCIARLYASVGPGGFEPPTHGFSVRCSTD